MRNLFDGVRKSLFLELKTKNYEGFIYNIIQYNTITNWFEVFFKLFEFSRQNYKYYLKFSRQSNEMV